MTIVTKHSPDTLRVMFGDLADVLVLTPDERKAALGGYAPRVTKTFTNPDVQARVMALKGLSDIADVTFGKDLPKVMRKAGYGYAVPMVEVITSASVDEMYKLRRDLEKFTGLEL